MRIIDEIMKNNFCAVKSSLQKITIFLLLGTISGLNSCSPNTQIAASTENLNFPTPTRTPFQPLPKDSDISRSSPVPAETQPPQVQENDELQSEPVVAPGQYISIWISPDLPEGLQEHLTLPENLRQTDVEDRSILQLEIGTDKILDYWVYALAAPFPTYSSDISFEDLLSTWWGESSGPLLGKKLILNTNTYNVFSHYWGEPEDQNILVLSENELLENAWNNGYWAILPFEDLQPRWKVIRVNNISPLEKYPDLEHYPLAIPLTLNGDPDYRNKVLSDPAGALFSNNHDPDLMTIMAVTGVTALVRATASTMESEGYPLSSPGYWKLVK